MESGKSDLGDLRILVGGAHPEFGIKVSDALGVRPISTVIGRHPDGEIKFAVSETVRRKCVFIIQPTCPPVPENLMELLVVLDALKRASPAEIVAVIPYFAGARQERKTNPREPITAKLIAELLSVAGGKRLSSVVSMDLHAGAIQGFFADSMDHVYSHSVFRKYIQDEFGKRSRNLAVISPDTGGANRARKLAEGLESPLAIIEKRRNSEGSPEAYNVIGDVEGKDVVIYDDIISTGGTLIKAANILRKRGAKRIWACAAHGIFVGNAVQNIENSLIERVAVSDSTPATKGESASLKISRISVAHMFAEVIRRIYKGESVSEAYPSN